MSNEDTVRFCRAVEVMGRIARAQIRVEGMKAENMQREQRGESIAYWNDSFEQVITDERIHHNDIVEELFHK